MTRILHCEMTSSCNRKVSHLDAGGFIYCAKHATERRQDQPCRKLRVHELRRLERGDQVEGY